MSHILRLGNAFLFCLLLRPKSHWIGEHHKAKMTDSEFRNLKLAFKAAQPSYFLHLCEMTVPYHLLFPQPPTHLPPTNNLDSSFIEKIEVVGNELIHLPTNKPLNSVLLYRSLRLWWTWSPSFYLKPFSSWPLGLMTSRLIKPSASSWFFLMQHLTVTQSFLLKIFTRLWVPLKSLSIFPFMNWFMIIQTLYLPHHVFVLLNSVQRASLCPLSGTAFMEVKSNLQVVECRGCLPGNSFFASQ